MTFDSWQERLYPEEYLEHWGIKGMKHGRRRFQNEDGTWTEAGLEARRKREGFGETRKERRAAKRVAKLERKQARKVARNEAAAARAEKKRLRSVKGLTDDELKARINRLKLENEYKDLKKSPLIETGVNLVNRYLDYKDKKEQKVLDLNRQKIEMARLKTQRIQAKESTNQAKYGVKTSANEVKKAKQEVNKMKEDVKGGLKYKRKAEYKDAKARLKAESRGAIRTALKNWADKGKENRKHAHEMEKMDRELTEQREKRLNALDVARQNAEQAKYKTDQERYKASQEAAKANASASERNWREINARTEYEKERKKKKP